MTLGQWFRDYVYIPLGGNRTSRLKWLRNIAVVWLLTGLWHGAEWNFVLWGGIFGVLLIIEKLWLGKVISRLPRVFSHIYTIIFIVLSFVIFNADGLSGVVNDLGGLFGAGGIPLVNFDSVYYLKSYLVSIIIAIIGCTPLPKMLWQKLPNKAVSILEPVLVSVVLIVSTAFIINGSYNPFLYFRF
jgi:alginate O-acetyltransferase complex protein AlgI